MTDPLNRKMPRTARRFVPVLLLLLALLVAGCSLFSEGGDDEVSILVVAPLTGQRAAEGTALLQGARTYANILNEVDGIEGRQVRIVSLDSEAGMDAIGKELDVQTADPGLLGAVVHGERSGLAELQHALEQAGIPSLFPMPLLTEQDGLGKWLFPTAVSEVRESRFMANYVRNVIGEKVISVIAEDTDRGRLLAAEFNGTLNRFGGQLVRSWTYPPGAGLETRVEAVANEMKQEKVPGSLVIIGSPDRSARVLAGLRSAGIANRVVGLSETGTNAFLDTLITALPRGMELADATNGVLFCTPLLFDTAGTSAQKFRTEFIRAHGTGPDWVASGGHDGVKMLLGAFKRIVKAGDAGGAEDLREAVREQLAAMNSLKAGVPGNAGPLFFEKPGVIATPLLAGVYNGAVRISDLVQLLPITDKGVKDYLKAVMDGRALYVNDRFMYKANVVYTGMHLLGIEGLDPEAGTVELDVELWFRYRQGKFAPENITFANAAEEIVLKAPEKELVNGVMVYRLYRVKGLFRLNYAEVQRPYGTNVVGLSFRHRDLSRNNLLYVTDIIGMDLTSTDTLEEALLRNGKEEELQPVEEDARRGWESLIPFLETRNKNKDPLVDFLTRSRVLAAAPGWVLDTAWVSQDMTPGSTSGDPAFVGYGKPDAVFSKIDFGLIIKPDRIQVRDFVPHGYFITFAVLALLGAVAAYVLDKRANTRTGQTQTLALRVVSWLLLLAAAGNLAMDFALQNYSTGVVDAVVAVNDMLWWLIPARLAVIALERLAWNPLETRTGRIVPNVIRKFTSAIIYTIAICGIIGFVFDQKLTSLLATSGVLVTVIGLAIKANIDNVFSGIVLNAERPFSVGDVIQVDEMVGKVVDMTWRSTRLVTHLDENVSIPNGKLSDAVISNFSQDKALATFSIFLSPLYGQDRVLAVLNKVLEDHPALTPASRRGMFVTGVEVFERSQLVEFTCWFLPEDYQQRVQIQDRLLQDMIDALYEAGIELTVLRDDSKSCIEEGVAGR